MLGRNETRLLVAIKAAEELGVPYALVGDRVENQSLKMLYAQELVTLSKTKNGPVAVLTQRGHLALTHETR